MFNTHNGPVFEDTYNSWSTHFDLPNIIAQVRIQLHPRENSSWIIIVSEFFYRENIAYCLVTLSLVSKTSRILFPHTSQLSLLQTEGL